MADLWVEVVAAVSGAFVGAVGGTAGSYWVWRLGEKKSRQKSLAAYLYAIAGSLEEMMEEFKRDEKPSQSGRRFKDQVDHYESAIADVSGPTLMNQMRMLRSLLMEAEEMDKIIYELPKARKEMWIQNAKTCAGSLQGKADRLLLD